MSVLRNPGINPAQTSDCKTPGRKPRSDEDSSGESWLSTQTGGHKFIPGNSGKQIPGFVDLNDGFILKAKQSPPRGERELGFYRWVSRAVEPELLELRPFLASFAGTVEREGGTYLKLANLTRGYLKPCVMDLKMGRISYDQDASPEKIANEIKKFPPRQNLGFQITGMVVYDPVNDVYEKYTKEYTRTLTEETIVSSGLGLFFRLQREGGRADVLPPLLAKLRTLEDWFSRQRKFSFIASSLLITYEGSQQLSGSAGMDLGNGHSPRLGDQGCERTVDSRSDADQDSGYPSLTSGQRCKNPVGRMPESNQDNVYLLLNGGQGCEGPMGSRSDGQRCEIPAEFSHLDRSAKPNVYTFSSKNECSDRIGLHLIDFGHVFPSSSIDHNVLFGIRKLIVCLQAMLS